jgi:hypothetical protein
MTYQLIYQHPVHIVSILFITIATSVIIWKANVPAFNRSTHEIDWQGCH